MRELAVAGADEGCLDGVDLARAADEPLLAEHDLRRVLGSRRAVRLLAEVRARDQPGGSELLVAQLAQHGRAIEEVGDLGPIGCSTSYGQSSRRSAGPRRRRSGAG